MAASPCPSGRRGADHPARRVATMSSAMAVPLDQSASIRAPRHKSPPRRRPPSALRRNGRPSCAVTIAWRQRWPATTSASCGRAPIAGLDRPTRVPTAQRRHLDALANIEPLRQCPRQAGHARQADQMRILRAIVPDGGGLRHRHHRLGKAGLARRDVLRAVIEAQLGIVQRDPARRHAPADPPPLVEQNRRQPPVHQPPGTGDACHAGADDQDVDAQASPACRRISGILDFTLK